MDLPKVKVFQPPEKYPTLSVADLPREVSKDVLHDMILHSQPEIRQLVDSGESISVLNVRKQRKNDNFQATVRVSNKIRTKSVMYLTTSMSNAATSAKALATMPRSVLLIIAHVVTVLGGTNQRNAMSRKSLLLDAAPTVKAQPSILRNITTQNLTETAPHISQNVGKAEEPNSLLQNFKKLTVSCRKQSTAIKACSWNVRSLNNKADDVMAYVIDNNIHVVLLTETWLNDINNDVTAVVKSNGYNIINVPRSCSEKTQVFIKSRTSFESVSAKFKDTNGQNICCTCIYRSGVINELFFSEFDEFLGSIFLKFTKLLVCGDFNIHLDNLQAPATVKFQDLISSHSGMGRN